MALYIDDRYLNADDRDFVELVTDDINRFMEAAALNDSLVLVFPAVSSRHRFLIHKSVEDFPTICSFSIGEGDHRRPAVCLEEAVMRNLVANSLAGMCPIVDKPLAADEQPISTSELQSTAASVPKTPGHQLENNVHSVVDGSDVSALESPPQPSPKRTKPSAEGEHSSDVPAINLEEAAIPPSTTCDHMTTSLPAGCTVNETVSELTETFNENDVNGEPSKHKHDCIASVANSVVTLQKTERNAADLSQSENISETVNEINDASEDDRAVQVAFVLSETERALESEEINVLSDELKLSREAELNSTTADALTLKGDADDAAATKTAAAAAAAACKLDAENACLALSTELKDACAIAANGSASLPLDQNKTTNSAEPAGKLDVEVPVAKESIVRSNELMIGVEENSEKAPLSLESMIADIRRAVDTVNKLTVELNPALLSELKIAVGEISVLQPESDYSKYLAAELDTLPKGADRCIEIYDIPDGCITRDVLKLFRKYEDEHFDIKWVDNTHAIGIFSSTDMAEKVVADFQHVIVHVQPLNLGSTQTKIVAKKCPDFFEAYKPRPKTSVAAARNMVTGALGLQRHLSKERSSYDGNDRHKLHKSGDRRHTHGHFHTSRDDRSSSSSSKRRSWDGKIRPCAMDRE